MDFFSHLLWSNLIFRKTKYWLLSIIITALPDLLSFGIFIPYVLLTGYHLGSPKDPAIIPYFVVISYSITHSFISFLVVALIVYFFARKYLIALLAWPIHIIIDIFTHTDKFFPTPFLWPLFDIKLSFISWGNLCFLLVNYELLFIIYCFLLYKKWRK